MDIDVGEINDPEGESRTCKILEEPQHVGILMFWFTVRANTTYLFCWIKLFSLVYFIQKSLENSWLHHHGKLDMFGLSEM